MSQFGGVIRSSPGRYRTSASSIALGAALAIGAAGGVAHAQTVIIESSNTTQILSTGTNYILNQGTIASARGADAIIVDGIAPVTFTNAGTITNGNVAIDIRAKPPEPVSGIRFNVQGSLVNELTGSILGDDRGVFINDSSVTITNQGDISAKKGPGIEFGSGSSGTIENFGTINNGNLNLLTGSSRGIGIDTSGIVTINNHVGASIRSGPGPSPTAITILSGDHVITNAGLIEAQRIGIHVTGGSAQITNRGIITSSTGTAISLESRNNRLILDTGSILNGFATSTGSDNHLRLQGSGFEDSPLTGFADLTMAGTFWTLSGAVSTTGTAANTIHVQTGTLTMSGVLSTGNNGGATIDPGAGLAIGAGGDTGSFTGNIVDNGVLTLQRSDDVIFPNEISGTGSLVKLGAGTVTLTGANSYSGGTRLEDGVLSVSSDVNLGNAAGGLTFFGGTLRTSDEFVTARSILVGDAGGTIDTAGSGATFTGLISGVASLVKTGGQRVMTLTGESIGYTGTLTIESGTVALGNGGTTGTIAGNVINSGGLVFNRVTDLVFGGAVAGIGNIVKQGSNRLTLSGNVSSTEADPAAIDVQAGVLTVTGTLATGDDGATTVLSGATLAIGNGGSTGDLVGDVVNNGAVVFDRATDLAYGESIVGPGTVAKQGAGTLTLLGLIASTSGVTIGGGVLQLGDGGEGLKAGNIVNNAALTFNRSDSYEQAGVISGSGTVSQQGSGRTTLSGINSYSGLTRIDAGRLDITGSLAGSAEVATGATLGGTGAVGGQVSIANGAHLTPGVSIGTLTVGSLVLNPGSQLDYQLGIPDIVGGASNDHMEIGGALTLDGTLNITDVGGFSQGVYQLIGYGGTLTDNGLQIGGVPPRFRSTGSIGSTGFMAISTATLGEVNLIVSGGGFGLQFWDGPNSVGNGVAEGGTASWNNVGTNWTLPDISSNAPWQGGFAVFQGAPGTVTLGENISFEGMQFRSDGYVIQNGGFLLQRGLDTILRVDPGMTATIAAEIADGPAGGSTLIKEGGGTLILDYANSYLGDTLIEAGILRVHVDANLGAPSNGLAFQGGTLAVGNGFSTGRGVIFNAEGGTIEVFGTHATFAGAITGPGAFTKTGTGDLVLEGSGNSYAGGTSIDAGTLTVATDSLLGDPAHGVALHGGALNVGGGFTSARVITIGEGGGTLETTGASATFTGILTGPGPLTKASSTNTIILTGANNYEGGTTISGGALQIGNGGTTGSILGNVLDNATLIFNRSDAYQVANNIDGSGGIEITGGGVADLVGNNNYEGETRISGGSTLIAALRENLGISGGGSTFMTLDSTLVLTGSFTLSGPFTIFDSTQTIDTAGETTNTTISGLMSGGGLLRKTGAGRLILVNGSNSYTGGTRIEEGTLLAFRDANLGAGAGSLAIDGATLLVVDGFTTGRTITLDPGGGTIEAGGAHATFAGTISGPGALSKTGPGEVLLEGAGNSYAGGTFINAGKLTVATDNLLGAATGGLTFDGGTLKVSGGFTSARGVTLQDGGGTLAISSSSATFAGTLAGPGGLTKVDAGAITLTGDNTYTGGTRIDSGVLEIGAFGGTTGSILGDIVDNGGVAFGRSDAYGVANYISGTGTVTFQNGGIATLTGNNSFTGDLRVFGLLGSPQQGSTIVAEANANLGSPTGNIILDTGPNKLVLANSFEITRNIIFIGSVPMTIDTRENIVTASGVVSGTVPLAKEGTGTLILTNTNSQTGGADINAGILQIGSGVGTGTLNGDVTIALGATLAFDRADALTFGGISGAGSRAAFGNSISGAGSVVQTGTGTLTAAGVHTYLGGTTVEGGRLLVNGAILGPTDVAGGARLGGTGSIGGTVTIADGASLEPGASVGTLTVGSLVLGAASLLNFELGLPDIVGGTTNDLVNVTDALTLDGTLQITNTGGFGRGVYRLINYGGALTDNGLLIGGPPTRFVTSDMLISTSTLGQVNLIVSSGGFGLQFWDGAGTLGNSIVDGGTANWNNAATNWTASDGVVNAPWQSGFAVFQGTAGTVTLGAPIAFEGMQFITSGYAIDGGGFGLAAAPDTIIRVDPSVIATINAPIADGAGGAARLTKTDAGVLILNGTNSYSGGTVVDGGALQIGADTNLGAAAGALSLNGGTLVTTASFASGRTITLGENGGIFSTNSGTQLSLGGAIAGTGALSKTGAGTLILSGANTYAGGTFLGAGVLAVSVDANLGVAVGTLDFGGGMLRFDASFNPAVNRAVSLAGPGGTIDTNGHDATFAQGIVGTGALTKIGTGTLTLTGANVYSGGTTISAGALQVGNGGTTGEIAGDVTNNASLLFNRSDAVTFGGAISGIGSLTKLGAGRLTLIGANNYAGGTTISAGSLQIGDGATSGSITGNVVDNGALLFNRSDAVTFSGTISGSGTLSQIGTGTLTLGGVNTHTGGTAASAGTIAVSSDLNLGASGAVLTLDGGTLLTTAAISSARPVTLAAGGGTIDNGGFADLFAGKIRGAGALTATGAGSVTLSAENDYSGGTTIAAGTLRIGNGGTTGSIVGDVVNSGVLTFARSNQLLFDGMVSGGGSAVQAGAGTTILTGINSYTGGTSIAAGTLQIGNGGTTGSITGDVANSSLLIFDRSDTLAFAGTISGAGSVLQAGTGTTILTGANSYAGGTTINAGTLAIGDGGTAGSVIGNVTNNGSLVFNRADVVVFTGTISGAGTVSQVGAGTLTLSGINSHTGGTIVRSGTLAVSNDLNLGAPTAVLTLDGGRLLTTAGITSARPITLTAGDGTIDNGGFADLFSGPIIGPGALALTGAGTVTLAANNNYTGGTTIETGTLRLGNGGTIGSIAGDVANDGTLVFDRSNALVFDGAISGTGTVVQQGGGTTTLTADSAYAGPSSVNNGRLLVDGTIVGAVNVASGARLGGTGTIDGTVTIADGGHLAPGHSPGTLTVGSLLLGPGSQLDYELGLPDIVGLGINDLTIVNGALTLDGTLNLTDAGGVSLGVYRIISYGGALTDNGLLLGAQPARFATPDLAISTAIAGEVNLIVSTSGGLSLQFWDGPHSTANGIVDGGGGIWNATTTNWIGFSGSPNATWQGGFAIFQGTAGAVTLGSPIAFAGMQFRTNNYLIAGGGFDLTAAGSTIIRVDPSMTATIGAPITGAATLTKGGGGMLVLGGTNSYTGGTAINSGTIRIGADANLGAAAGALSLDSGTLETTASFASSRAVALGENGGTFSIGTGTQLTLGGAITGAGLLGKTGAGTLVLTGANSQAGGTFVGAGILHVSSDANLGAATAPLVLDGGTLRFGTSFDPAATRPVGLGSLGGTIDTNGNNSTFAQGISGPGALTKQGAGILILTGANTYGGGTTISAGTLRIGNGGTTGSLLGDIVNNGALGVDRSGQISYAGTISGTGSLTQAGTGTTVLTGSNSYSGGTLISAGALQIGNGGTSGSIIGNVIDNGLLAFSRSDAITFGGAISGAGALRQAGSGTLILTGASSYTGPTTVVRGRLEVAGSLGNTAVTVASGATLSGGGAIAGPATVVDGAHFAPGPLAAPGTLSVGALTFAPGARLDWRVGLPNVIGGRLNDVAHVAGNLTLDGTLDLTATSNFATLPGSYRLIEYGGALTNNGLALGLLPASFAATQVQTAIPGQVNLVAIRDGIAIQFWDGSDGLGNGQVNGGTGNWSTSATNWTAPNGAINQQWLSGMAIFAAPGGIVTLGTGVEAIALQFTADGYRIQGNALTLRPHGSGFGGLVRVDPGVTAEINAAIVGTTGLTKSDAGTLILTGANNYSGGTTIRGGTLQIGAGGTAGSIGGNVDNDGRLVFNRSDSITFAGVISGLGAVDQIGNGILTLTGANSYSGGTNVRAGTLQITRDANIGGATGALLVGSATLRWMAAFDLAATRPIILGAGSASFDTNGLGSTISQRIGGPGGLTKTGAGRLVLAGNSDYAGPTSIAAGELAVNGSIRSATTVGANGVLSGTGSIFGNVLNRGLIAPGNSIGTLTISGSYSGEGGTLDIETVLGADDSPSDRLVIASGAATGSTMVRVFNLGGEGALTTGDGILVVDAAAGGTTAPGAFTLAAPVLAGPYEYQLLRGGASGSAADDWFLRSALEPDTPSFRIETSLYAALPALALTYGRSLMGTLHARVGELAGPHADPGHDGAIWGRVLGRDGKREGKNGVLGEGPNYKYDLSTFQVGVDVIHNSGDHGGDFAGLYGGYGQGDGNVRHFTGVKAGKSDFDAWSIGAYWTHFTPTGWYLDGVVQGTWYDMKAKSMRLPEVKTNGFGFAASIEGGRALQSGGLTIEPQAQLIFQTVSLDDVADVAAQVRFDNMQSLAGRLGVRVAKTWAEGDQNAVTLWGRANFWYEFMGDTRTEFSSGAGLVPVHADLGGEWIELNAGIDAQITKSLSVHANVTYETDFGNDQRGYEAQLGVRLRW